MAKFLTRARGAGMQTVDGFKTRTPFQTQFDFQAAYNLRMSGARKITVMADIFNLFDQQTILDYDTWTEITANAGPNPNFGLPTTSVLAGNPPHDQTPRQIRFGVRFEFDTERFHDVWGPRLNVAPFFICRRSGMTRRLSVVVIVIAVLTAPAPVHAQQLADEQSRREAVQFFRTGQEFYAGERFDRAVEAFTRSVAKDPLFTLAHYQLGQSYMNLQRYASAIQAFQKCLEASRALFGLSQSNRFAVEKQRDDEIREMRESINVMQALASRSPGNGYALRVERAQQHLRDLESQLTSLGTGFRARPPKCFCHSAALTFVTAAAMRPRSSGRPQLTSIPSSARRTTIWP